MTLRAGLVACAFALACPRGGAAQADLSAAAADTFEDDLARDLVARALATRRAQAEGLDSYEAEMVQRVGIRAAVTRRLPLRARTLYHREEVARVRWSRDGPHVLRWVGRRSGSPSVGEGWAEGDGPFGLKLDLEEALAVDDLAVAPFFDPAGDRLDFFEAGFVMPASETGLSTYRFRSGDTLRISLPPPSRSLTLIEVIVEPRQAAWDAVEGSLWFDRDSGTLTRAVFRPSDVWDHEERQPGDLDDVPGFLKPAIGTVHHIVLDYALHEQRWWLPRRLLAEGTFEWGHGALRLPLTIEWTMSDYRVNETPSGEVSPRPGLLPRTGVSEEGAFVVRSSSVELGNAGTRERTLVVTPRGVDLARAPELPEPIGDQPDLKFDEAELAPLLERLTASVGQEAPPPQPGLRRTLLGHVRFDRVRGLSVGWTRAWGVGGAAGADAEVRVGTAAPEPSVILGLERGRWRLDAFHDLRDADHRGSQPTLGNSISTLVFGQDDGQYYRASGAALAARFGDPSLFARVTLAGERHRSVDQEVDRTLATLTGGGLRPNLEADDVDVLRLVWEISGQRGDDPDRGVLTWRTRAEAGFGDVDYQRASGGVSLLGPSGLSAFGQGLDGALELSAGIASDAPPAQRRFMVGGARSLRGFLGGALQGTGFWAVRAELGGAAPGLRGLLFSDVAWAGPRADFWRSRPSASVGVGASLLDGLVRLDLAKGIVRGGGWRLHAYVDGLF